jgi:hypothetical protein
MNAAGLVQTQSFDFASRMKEKRIYVVKQRVELPKEGLNLAFPGSGRRPRSLKIRETNTRATFHQQPTPLNDFLNFKTMTGNEILLNMENVDNFTTSELIASLIELGKRDREHRFNWTLHPTTAKCLHELMNRVGHLSHKHAL